MVAMNKTNVFAVRGQVDRAAAEVRLLQMPAWPAWVAYMAERLEAVARQELEATDGEVREMLEAIRASLDERLAGGSW